MKAVFLNGGLGARTVVITNDHPKCMTEISVKDTILSRASGAQFFHNRINGHAPDSWPLTMQLTGTLGFVYHFERKGK